MLFHFSECALYSGYHRLCGLHDHPHHGCQVRLLCVRAHKSAFAPNTCCVSLHPSCSSLQPYQNEDLQQLAPVCSVLLVLMSAVLLRSQSLISSARQINFNPQRPGMQGAFALGLIHLTSPLQMRLLGALKPVCQSMCSCASAS